MRRKSTRILYFLLFVWALISMSYYIAGATALREEWFHGERNARAPFDFKDDAQTLTLLQKEAKNASLSDGDVLQSLNGKPYTGWFQINNEIRRARPGDTVEVSARAKDGRTKEARVRLAHSEGPGFTLGGYIAFLTPILGVPLLGLIVGYWVVAARPRDPKCLAGAVAAYSYGNAVRKSGYQFLGRHLVHRFPSLAFHYSELRFRRTRLVRDLFSRAMEDRPSLALGEMADFGGIALHVRRLTVD